MRNIKLISALLLAMLLATFISCSSNNKSKTNPQTTTENSSQITATTKENYEKYLSERYNHYFGDSNRNKGYDIYSENFTFNGTNEEFLVAYNNSYTNLKTNLQSFKADLQNYVKKGTLEVDNLNAEVITDIDKAILSVDNYTSSFAEKT